MTRSLEERVTELEIGIAVVRHDVGNMRMGVTGLDVKIDKLQTSIVRVGMSIVGSVIMLLLGIIAYFIIQKDVRLTELQSFKQTQQLEKRQ